MCNLDCLPHVFLNFLSKSVKQLFSFPLLYSFYKDQEDLISFTHFAENCKDFSDFFKHHFPFPKETYI